MANVRVRVILLLKYVRIDKYLLQYYIIINKGLVVAQVPGILVLHRVIGGPDALVVYFLPSKPVNLLLAYLRLRFKALYAIAFGMLLADLLHHKLTARTLV